VSFGGVGGEGCLNIDGRRPSPLLRRTVAIWCNRSLCVRRMPHEKLDGGLTALLQKADLVVEILVQYAILSINSRDT